METIHKYRHIIDRAVALDFEKALRKAISILKPKKLGFVGIIDSPKKEYHHDIDVMVFPSKKAKIGEALIELIKLYDEAEKQLKKKHKRYYLVTCPLMSMQQLIYYIASIEEGAAGMIPIHSLFFTNHRDFKRFNPKEFQTEIKKQMVTLHGDFSIIKEIKALPQGKLEPYYFILNFELNARIRNFPRHSVRASAEHLFHYLNTKYNIQISKEIPHSLSDIQKEFEKLMKKLDKITYG